MNLTNYLFYVEGIDLELWVAAADYKTARRNLWASLTPDEHDCVIQIECIDEEPITVNQAFSNFLRNYAA